MRIGLISNSRSHRNRNGLRAIEEIAAAHPQISHQVVDGVAEIARVIDGFARAGVEVLAVNGGDGTVQAVVTHLGEAHPYPELPHLVLLPGGMTNMTAFDLGPKGSVPHALARLVSLIGDGDIDRAVVRRPVLRLQASDGRPAQHGFFFGAGAIVAAIELCRRHAHTLGLKADVANAATIVGSLVHWLFARRQNALFHGEDMLIEVDNDEAAPQSLLLVLATTLDRLVVGSRPFWDEASGPIHFTTIAYPPRGLVRYAPRILYGNSERRLPKDVYVSRGVHRLGLTMHCGFTIDGELFETAGHEPVRLGVGETVRFLKF